MTDQSRNSSKQQAIQLTPEAVAEVKRLMALEKDTPSYLRLGVQAGGCSGMSYSMAFDSSKGEFDQEFVFDDLRVLVDRRALMYLAGVSLEYKGGLDGGFSFVNPNAKRSCGCGTSFTC